MSDIVAKSVPSEELRDTIVEWKNTVEQSIAAYLIPPSRGLIHGLQKDAIQNSWDAKVNTKGKDWSVIFEFVQTPDCCYFVIRDEGTSGLTGKILTRDEMGNLKEAQKELPVEELWGRFEAQATLLSAIDPPEICSKHSY